MIWIFTSWLWCKIVSWIPCKFGSIDLYRYWQRYMNACETSLLYFVVFMCCPNFCKSDNILLYIFFPFIGFWIGFHRFIVSN